ncbi:MAG TPA: tetratricopeptide repeat protein [Chthoniobacterales bacterium]
MSVDPPSDFEMEIAYVLFIDVVGFTRLLINEQGDVLNSLNGVIRKTATFQSAETAGKLVRLPAGDGMALAFFTQPEAPVRCALEISEALKNHPRLQVRMGIHSGPVSAITDVNDRSIVAGTGINMAQRVMDCGDAGHILLSRRIADDLAQYARWTPHLHDLRVVEVKHGVKIDLVNLYTAVAGNSAIPEKIRQAGTARSISVRTDGPQTCTGNRKSVITLSAVLLLGVLAISLFLVLNHTPPKSTTAVATTLVPIETTNRKSVAVLPFENLSDEKSNAYFAEGIQDEILTRLSKIGDLKVISRTSTEKYKSAPDNLREIAQQLGVANVLEGSVQKTGDQVRITVQLINALVDSHLWAETYDRKLIDTFAIESDVAQKIAASLEAKLTGSEQHTIAARPTDNTEAYQLYLKGRFFWNKRTAGDFNTALSYFQQAVAADPNYAVAYAGMADCYLLLPLFGGAAPADLYPKAKAMAQKALALDPNLAEAHASLGLLHASWDFDFPESVREMERAIQLNPNYATAHHWYGNATLPPLGQFDHAIDEMQRALALDPLSVIINGDLGWNYLNAGRFDEAIAQLRKTLEMDPRGYFLHLDIGQALEGKGDLAGAIAEYEQAAKLNDDPTPLGLLGAAKAKAGQPDAARAILRQLEETAKRRYVPDYLFTTLHLALGEKEEALAWLESAFAKRQPDVAMIRVDPVLKPLYGDPRFEALAEKIVSAREFRPTAAQK